MLTWRCSAVAVLGKEEEEEEEGGGDSHNGNGAGAGRDRPNTCVRRQGDGSTPTAMTDMAKPSMLAEKIR